MMSASEGGGGRGKADIVGGLREFHATNQFQLRMSLMDAPL